MVIVLTENTKTIILFNKTPFFLSLNLVTPLLFEEMLDLTSY